MNSPVNGFQVESVGDMIEPGQDVEYCEVLQLPGDPSETYYVNRFEVGMTQHSHHLLVAAAIPDSDTEKALALGMKKKCVSPDTFGGELNSVTGSQHRYNDEKFPDGVGKIFHGGQFVIFDYHYLNTSSAPVQARAAVNFHTIDAADVKRVARSFGFYNFGIQIPAMSKASFTESCVFSHDVIVHRLTRHTHRWGTEFPIAFAGGARDGEHVWTSPSYEETDFNFPEPVLMPAGTGFEFTCNFDNTTSGPLKFGVKATDEMCILFGSWYVANDGDEVPSQGCDVF
ncbi:MAG: hypothetical protein EXR75_06855 [Myxococcales bacterium]|nr:hypothetical protein [Myxococcales bacterium]